MCDRLVSALGLSGSWQTKFHALYQKQNSYILLKPQTYMNESGVSVQEAAHFFGIAPADILVVHDDIELPFGEVRRQIGGGMGGHNASGNRGFRKAPHRRWKAHRRHAGGGLCPGTLFSFGGETVGEYTGLRSGICVTIFGRIIPCFRGKNEKQRFQNIRKQPSGNDL